MPDFEGWAIFAQVAEDRSFTAAATTLGLSSGTVSKAIARLEQTLGVTLLHRTTRSVTLTPTGQALVSRASALLSDAEEVENAARDEGAGPRGLVRIAAPMSFGLAHIAPALPDLVDILPEVTIDLDLDDAPTDLVAAGIDIALRIGWPQDSGLKSRKLADVCTAIVASPAYLARSGTPATLEELSGHAAIAYANVRPHDQWVLQNRTGEEARVTIHKLLTTNSGDAMLPLLRAGKAIASMPRFMVAEDIAEGRLIAILTEWSFRTAGLYLVTPSSGPRPSRVTAVIEFFANRLSAVSLS